MTRRQRMSRMPPARPKPDQRRVEAIAYRRFVRGEITTAQYLGALRRAKGASS